MHCGGPSVSGSPFGLFVLCHFPFVEEQIGATVAHFDPRFIVEGKVMVELVLQFDGAVAYRWLVSLVAMGAEVTLFIADGKDRFLRFFKSTYWQGGASLAQFITSSFFFLWQR
jgi:hypothetical protein